MRAVAAGIRAAALAPVRDIAFGYAAVTVWYDVLHTVMRPWRPCSADAIVAAAKASAMSPATVASPGFPAGREHVIPVRYDGPDLPDVARRTGLAVADVIARHSARTYTVYFLGFVPGWAYLGDLDPALVVPRRTEPRARVPAGSVAIAGAQTGVYPYAIPGGWHSIGHTLVGLFDPMRDPPWVRGGGPRAVRAGRRVIEIVGAPRT